MIRTNPDSVIKVLDEKQLVDGSKKTVLSRQRPQSAKVNFHPATVSSRQRPKSAKINFNEESLIEEDLDLTLPSPSL